MKSYFRCYQEQNASDHSSCCFDICNFLVNIKLLKALWVSLCSVYFRFDNLKSNVTWK